MLADPEPAERGAAAIGNAAALITVARDYCYPMALEAALMSTTGPAAADMTDLVATLRERGATVLEVADRADAELTIPTGLGEPLAAIVTVVRAQQVALALARHRGLDPDAPRGLSKVTLTT